VWVLSDVLGRRRHEGGLGAIAAAAAAAVAAVAGVGNEI